MALHPLICTSIQPERTVGRGYEAWPITQGSVWSQISAVCG